MTEDNKITESPRPSGRRIGSRQGNSHVFGNGVRLPDTFGAADEGRLIDLKSKKGKKIIAALNLKI